MLPVFYFGGCIFSLQLCETPLNFVLKSGLFIKSINIYAKPQLLLLETQHTSLSGLHAELRAADLKAFKKWQFVVLVHGASKHYAVENKSTQPREELQTLTTLLSAVHVT